MELTVSIAYDLILKEAIETIKKSIKNKKKTTTVAVAMFDLVGSTYLKRALGHSKGTHIVLEHNLMCEKISEKFDGSVIKHMGDGLFIEFEDPSNACLAAVEIRNAIAKAGRFQTKGGITFGMVERIKIGGIQDLIGTTIDRCARLVSLAQPNQILIDTVLYGVAESFIRDNSHLLISDPITKKN
jgi:class 3 adenylate cyclase